MSRRNTTLYKTTVRSCNRLHKVVEKVVEQLVGESVNKENCTTGYNKHRLADTKIQSVQLNSKQRLYFRYS